MRRLASCLLVAGLALAGAGCGSSRKATEYHDGAVSGGSQVSATVRKGVRVGPGPFLFWGDTTGAQSGLFGDGADGPHGTSIGCLNGRRYADALGIQNGTKIPLRLIAASGPNPHRRIVDRVAIQLHLSPPPHPQTGYVDTSDLVYRPWSAKSARPVTIPPGRIATVQRNFLLRNCRDIGEGKAIVIPGALVVRYSRSGHAHTQKLTIPGDRLVVVHGPTRHTCDPVSGSASFVTSDASCAFARHAAPRCHAMKNGGWLGCTIAGRFWECGRFAGPGYPLLEKCYLPHEKSHWFAVVWTAQGLGLWGAVDNSRAVARHTPAGVCEDRPSGGPLTFESKPVRVLSSRGGARVAAAARVKFVVRGYGGPRSFPATGSTGHGGSAVEVLLQRHGVTRRTFGATTGRLTVAGDRNGVIAGSVFASLREVGGTARVSLNGTWSCRTTVG
jgi:hypothetical protein